MNRIIRAADALGIRRPRNVRSKLAKLTALLVALLGLSLNVGVANAATLSTASVALSDPRPDPATSSYNFTASSFSNSHIECIKETFATTATGSTKPTNMVTASGISLNASSDLVTAANWTRGGSDADGTVTFTYATGETPSAGTHTVNLDGFVNPDASANGYYLQFSTYNNTDCSTSPVDNVTVGFTVTAGSTLSLTVDGSLSFTVSGVAHGTSCGSTGVTTTGTAANDSTSTTIPLGTVTTGANTIGCQQLTAGTNATHGYTIYVRDLAQLKNTLNQTYADQTGSNASPATFPAAGATEAYGYTTDDFTLGTGTAGRFNGPLFAPFGHSTDGSANGEVAYENAPISAASGIYYIATEASMTSTTKPGVYTTTVVYTCTPVY